MCIYIYVVISFFELMLCVAKDNDVIVDNDVEIVGAIVAVVFLVTKYQCHYYCPRQSQLMTMM